MTKILIYIPIWHRSKLFETVAASLRTQTDRLKHYEVTVLCCISPEDSDVSKLNLICERHHFYVINHSNDYMGAKMNAGMSASLSFDYDYLMNFGSDDLIHRKLFDLYVPYTSINLPFFGIRSLYFFDVTTKKAIFYSYRKPTCIGAGRMIHRSVVEAIIKSGHTIYTPERQKALDWNSKVNIEQLTGIRDTVINVDDFPYLVDMKSDTNINSYQSLFTHGMHVAPASVNFAVHYPGVTI
jgi:hypothetical protein